MVVLNLYCKENDGFGYFFFVIDVFLKYVWIVVLKFIKGSEMLCVLVFLLLKIKKFKKIWIDKGFEFMNRDV